MKLPRPAAFVAALVALLFGAAAPAWAQGQFDKPKYASIVVDANSGEVLYALHADDSRYPASITKIMTLYLTFEALATGRLSMDDRVPFSPHAASMAPSKLGVPAGQDISVAEAIQATAVMSANDAATALAERVGGGSEGRFASLMTLRGQELGMKRTRFLNANGLPEARHDVNTSTARDIAVLSRAVMRDYPQYYHFFNQRAFSWHGRTTLNHNRLLLRMVGMDGLKTGYTNAAGFNLAASAVRDGRRLITVVLGGSSSAARNENVETLLQAGFDVMERRSHGQPISLASLLSEPEDGGGPILRPPYEMGSGEQSGLQVVTADAPPPPAARPMQVARLDAPPPAARFAPPARAPLAVRASAPRVAEVCDEVSVRRHHRVTHQERCHAATAAQVLAAAPDCRRLRGKTLRACEADRREAQQVARAASAGPDCAGLRGRSLKACRSDARAEVQVAKADPVATKVDCAGLRGRSLRACRADARSAPTPLAKAEAAAPDCGKAHGRIARAACKADDADAAPSRTAKAEGGSYMIQVGAFGSRTDAQAHLAKLSRAGLNAGGAERVETTGHAYRARFAGLSKGEAAAACAKLSAKGERCMVVAR